MKIALIGATGSVGSRVAAEALARGHRVTAVSRHPDKVEAQPGLQAVAGDLSDPRKLAEALKDHDVVVSAVRFRDYQPAQLLQAYRASGAGRLVVVGGAGSLKVASGALLAETPSFPEAVKPEAQAGQNVLDALRGSDVNWTFLSPSALFAPGKRTGSYRLGADDLLIDADGKSWISQEDYAIALVDELEKNAHPRQRLTVGY